MTENAKIYLIIYIDCFYTSKSWFGDLDKKRMHIVKCLCLFCFNENTSVKLYACHADIYTAMQT